MKIMINTAEWSLCLPLNEKGIEVAERFLELLEELLEEKENIGK